MSIPNSATSTFCLKIPSQLGVTRSTPNISLVSGSTHSRSLVSLRNSTPKWNLTTHRCFPLPTLQYPSVLQNPWPNGAAIAQSTNGVIPKPKKPTRSTPAPITGWPLMLPTLYETPPTNPRQYRPANKVSNRARRGLWPRVNWVWLQLETMWFLTQFQVDLGSLSGPPKLCTRLSLDKVFASDIWTHLHRKTSTSEHCQHLVDRGLIKRVLGHVAFTFPPFLFLFSAFRC